MPEPTITEAKIPFGIFKSKEAAISIAKGALVLITASVFCLHYMHRPDIEGMRLVANAACKDKGWGEPMARCTAELFTKQSLESGPVRGIGKAQEVSFMVGDYGVTLKATEVYDSRNKLNRNYTRFEPIYN